MDYIFNPTAEKVQFFVNNGAVTEHAGTEILKTLINELVADGWDTWEESEERFTDVPFIALAFEESAHFFAQDEEDDDYEDEDEDEDKDEDKNA